MIAERTRPVPQSTRRRRAAPARRPRSQPIAQPKAHPVSLNTLSVRWRIALDTAQEALRASATSRSTALSPDAYRRHTARAARERETVGALLRAAARDEHVKLVRSLTLPSLSKAQLGLARTIRACVFDLEGVLAPTADLHFAAWSEAFDEFLAARFQGSSVHFSHYQRLSRRSDYEEYLHGKPRLDGVRGFLASRGITLPEGASDDAPGTPTVYGIANRKNDALRRRIAYEGVSAYEGAHRYLEAAGAAGVLCAVVSASANTSTMLESAGLTDLIDVRIDGNAMRARRLQAKPAADTVLAACRDLAVEPAEATAFATTSAGIAAARSAGVASVVAVDRTGDADALRGAGAECVIGDLSELLSARNGAHR